MIILQCPDCKRYPDQETCGNCGGEINTTESIRAYLDRHDICQALLTDSTVEAHPKRVLKALKLSYEFNYMLLNALEYTDTPH